MSWILLLSISAEGSYSIFVIVLHQLPVPTGPFRALSRNKKLTLESLQVKTSEWNRLRWLKRNLAPNYSEQVIP